MTRYSAGTVQYTVLYGTDDIVSGRLWYGIRFSMVWDMVQSVIPYRVQYGKRYSTRCSVLMQYGTKQGYSDMVQYIKIPSFMLQFGTVLF